jgi:hypothetical protein
VKIHNVPEKWRLGMKAARENARRSETFAAMFTNSAIEMKSHQV